MAINKAMLAALKAISYVDIDVKKAYPAERLLENVRARLNIRPARYKTWDHVVKSYGYDVPVRVYPPTEGEPLGTLVFFHGGGWVTGNIDTYDSVCCNMSRLTQRTVISVDYRLAPEHKFPAAPEDCYAVVRELFDKHMDGAGPESVCLIGDSAGANLAAAVSLMRRDRGDFIPHKQILIYPATYCMHDSRSPFESVRTNGSDYLLTSKRVSDYMALYRSSDADMQNPYFAPLMADDYSRQPKTLIITAEFCPLRDEGEEYGRRLRAAGNSVRIRRVRDALHGFFSLPPRFIHVKTAYALINKFLGE